MSGPDYIVDIAGIKSAASGEGSRSGIAGGSSGSIVGRPWISIRWKCCSSYSRIYRNQAGTMYCGQCPRCGRPAKVMIGEGGSSNRFFEAE